MVVPTYWKVPFEWPGNLTLESEAGPRDAHWLPAREVPQFVELVATVLAGSVGPEDRAAVERFGPTGAAERLLSPASGFSYRPGWWEVLVHGGAPAGFVLPVIYDGARRDDRDEATIYHMGIVPQQRGRGLGRLLLRRAMRTLLDHGVWRIYCDTPADNAAMIRLFESEGWKRLPAHRRPVDLDAWNA